MAWRRNRVRASSSSAARSVAASSMRPASGLSRPAIRFSSVDLPVPDSPTIATTAPGSTASDSPSRIVRVPYRLTSPLIDSMVAF